MPLGLLLQLIAAGMGSPEYSYVVRGATLQCSNGTDPGVLNMPTCHGVYIKDQPVMNVADTVVDANISVFGFCKSTQALCTPEFCTKWSDGQEHVLLDQEPALLSKSKLVCSKYGGEITIVHDGQL